MQSFPRPEVFIWAGANPKMMTNQLPDKMTGQDLINQENYEFGLEQQLVDQMDRVDRRDKRDEIISAVPSIAYLMNYDKIFPKQRK